MRLHGSWTYYTNTSDVWDHDDDDKPIISFSRDGRFVDGGLFKAGYLPIPENYDADGPPVGEADVAPGQGWYEIVDFTLILNYDDGRTRTAAFSPFFGDPADEVPVSVYVYHVRLWNMD